MTLHADTHHRWIWGCWFRREPRGLFECLQTCMVGSGNGFTYRRRQTEKSPPGNLVPDAMDGDVRVTDGGVWRSPPVPQRPYGGKLEFATLSVRIKPDTALLADAKPRKYPVQQVFMGESASDFGEGVLGAAEVLCNQFGARVGAELINGPGNRRLGDGK